MPTGANAIFPTYSKGSGNALIVGKPEWQPVVLLRDPVVEMIVRTMAKGDLAPGGATSDYAIEFGLSAVEFALNPTTIVDFTSVPAGFDISLPISGLKMSVPSPSGYNVYGDYVVSGSNNGERVIWLDAGHDASAEVYLACTSGATVVNDDLMLASLVLHTGPDETVPVSQGYFHNVNTWLELNTPLTTETSGYYSVRISSDHAPAGAKFSMLREANRCFVRVQTCAGFRHIMSESLVNKAQIVDQVRVNGCSLLCQNVVTNFTRGGTVYAVQTTGVDPWYTMFGSTETLSNFNLNQRYVGPWEKGLYTFVKPQGDKPMALRPAWERANASAVDTYGTPLPMFRPFSDQGNVCVLMVPATVSNADGNTVYPTSTATLTVCRAIEYTTRDQFFDVESPSLPPQLFDSYSYEIGTVPQFYENPLHLHDIARVIGNVLGTASYFLPPGLKQVAQLGGGTIKFVGQWLEKRHDEAERKQRISRVPLD